MKTEKQIQRRKQQRKNAGYVKGLRKRATLPEIVLGQYLLDKKIYFIFQKGFLTPFHRIVDFYLPKRQIIIEVDGDIHRFSVDKDKNKDTQFSIKRYMQTLRLTNKEVMDGTFIKKIEPFINSPIKEDSKKITSFYFINKVNLQWN